MAGLTPKQATFVQEYLVDLNGTQAAIRAGYSEHTANEQAARLLAKASVKEAVQVAMNERAERTGITADKVLTEFAKIGFTDLTSVISWGSKEVAFGYDDEGRKLAPQDIGDAVLVQREMAPFVEAIDSEMLTEMAKAAVAEVSLTKDGLRVKMHDKVGALTQMGRHLGMFKDKTELSGGVSVEAITVRIVDPKNGP